MDNKGLYKFHRGQTLLMLTTQAHYQQCESIRQTCPDADKVFEAIKSSRSIFLLNCLEILVKWTPGQQSRLAHAQYKNILICVLPQYKSEQADSYNQQFRNVVKQVIDGNKDITIQFSPTSDGHHTPPNQMLLALMFRQISAQIKNGSLLSKSEGIKISLVSS